MGNTATTGDDWLLGPAGESTLTGEAQRDATKSTGIDWLDKLQGRGKYTPVELGGTTNGGLMDPAGAGPSKPPPPAAPVKPPPNANPSGLTPTTADDMIAPGVGQQAFDWYGGNFFEPTTGKDLWGDIGEGFQKPGVNEEVSGGLAKGLAKKGTQGDTYGVDYWQGMSGKTNTPDMIDKAWKNVEGLENDVSGFYDNAFNSAQRNLNRSQAARGRFNSSDAVRASGEQANQFAGARAKDESQFRLQRAQAMDDLAVQGTNAKRDWITGMGDLAFKAGTEQREYADTASQIADRAQRSQAERMQGAFDAAFGVDQNSTNRMATGMEAAFGAQELHDERAYKGMENEILLGDKTAEIYSKEKLLEAGLTEDQIAALMGAATDEVNASTVASNTAHQGYLDQLNTSLEAYNRTKVGTYASNNSTPAPVQSPYAPNMSGGPTTKPPP